MRSNNHPGPPLDSLARDYLAYLGRHLPQQCASDEFYFLPRAEAAPKHLDRLDELAPDRIQNHLRYVRDLLRQVPAQEQDDLEAETDRVLLRQSLAGFLWEYDQARAWQTDPTLYLKVPLFALAHLLARQDLPARELKQSLAGLLARIPSFLRLGAQNLRAPSRTALEVAGDMSADALAFHRRDLPALLAARLGKAEALARENQAALEAWAEYKTRLSQLPGREAFALGQEGLKQILAVMGSPRLPQEILELAREDASRTEAALQALARGIEPGQTWPGLIYERFPSPSSPDELLRLYQDQVQNLRRFFYAQDLLTLSGPEEVLVLETPVYLCSLRATASYQAPLPGQAAGPGLFYLTPGREGLALLAAHCPYLSAHETYPGHHVLDHLRLHHPHPLRRQIEAPLFYEGWACYAEQLLDELGYVQDPRQKLIGLKRRLWRSLRAVLDVKLQTGQITPAQAAREIQALGFSPAGARRQVRRFALTPGYQLGYFMGLFEILRLRERFSARPGRKAFHEALLGGGQVPFPLLERRLEAGL